MNRLGHDTGPRSLVRAYSKFLLAGALSPPPAAAAAPATPAGFPESALLLLGASEDVLLKVRMAVRGVLVVADLSNPSAPEVLLRADRNAMQRFLSRWFSPQHLREAWRQKAGGIMIRTREQDDNGGRSAFHHHGKVVIVVIFRGHRAGVPDAASRSFVVSHKSIL
jgi:hypothetical protein